MSICISCQIRFIDLYRSFLEDDATVRRKFRVIFMMLSKRCKLSALLPSQKRAEFVQSQAQNFPLFCVPYGKGKSSTRKKTDFPLTSSRVLLIEMVFLSHENPHQSIECLKSRSKIFHENSNLIAFPTMQVTEELCAIFCACKQSENPFDHLKTIWNGKKNLSKLHFNPFSIFRPIKKFNFRSHEIYHSLTNLIVTFRAAFPTKRFFYGKFIFSTRSERC